MFVTLSVLLFHLVANQRLDYFGIGLRLIFFLVRAGYFIAIICDELLQALNGFRFLVIRAEVENLSHRAVFPGLDPYLGARFLLRQGASVVGYGDTGNYEPFSFGTKMGIGIASTRAAYLEGLQSPLFQVELQGINRAI